ncbi:hypothetical protein BV22DRAFT_1135237 [Leucogyrophana mollusca]|uniref:Uncharacterized protein n=1 Tax=Leucogyrophana mollusca TaxID=85980 RepID=A0ACB8AW96_9AGAM|nr:hypothetical protein BV22DRAFT_1135237 [Leucogyrophana mollusca]
MAATQHAERYFTYLRSQLSSDARRYIVHQLAQEWVAGLSDISPRPLPFAFETFLLAKEHELPSCVLKRAFYELLRKEGLGLPSEGLPHYDHKFTRGDYFLLVRTRETFDMTWLKAVIRKPEAHRDESCVCVPGDAQTRYWAASVIDVGLDIQYLHDPVCGLLELMRLELAGYCDRCAGKARTAWKEARLQLWVHLDQVLTRYQYPQ